MTLEVSKLSGWLNADASCRESKGRHTVRGEVYGSGHSRQRATAAQAACRRGLDCIILRAGHGEERTSNMPPVEPRPGPPPFPRGPPPMVMTLEVSKLSGWLNTLVPCRESERGHTGRGEVYGPEGGASSVQGRARLQITGPRHGKERTRNMLFMSLTLEVSTLSGWLNAYAFCRESKRGHTVRGEVCWPRGGRRRATTAQAACRGRRDCGLGAGHGVERT